MRTGSGLTTVTGFEIGWNDADERYMSHLDDVYGGRIIEMYASTTFVRYREKKEERIRIADGHAADQLLIAIVIDSDGTKGRAGQGERQG